MRPIWSVCRVPGIPRTVLGMGNLMHRQKSDGASASVLSPEQVDSIRRLVDRLSSLADNNLANAAAIHAFCDEQRSQAKASLDAANNELRACREALRHHTALAVKVAADAEVCIGAKRRRNVQGLQDCSKSQAPRVKSSRLGA